MLSDAHTVHHVCALLDTVLPALVLDASTRLYSLSQMQCLDRVYHFPIFVSYAVVYLYLVCFYFYRARIALLKAIATFILLFFVSAWEVFLLGTRCDIFF